MAKNVDAGDVVREFHRLRQERTGQRPPTFRRPEVLEAAQRFLDRFRELGADDPLAFLRWRWDAAQHAGHPVGLRQLAGDTTLITRWRDFGHGHTLSAAASARLTRKAGTVDEQQVKELRLLTRGMEAAKAPHAARGRFDLCLVDEFTGGFHPASRTCASCPEAVRCAARLYQSHGWDVVALRANRLHLLPKEVAAAAVR